MVGNGQTEAFTKKHKIWFSPCIFACCPLLFPRHLTPYTEREVSHVHTVHALASQVLALAPADKVVPIDLNAFKRPPPWMNGMAGGVVLLFLLMKVGQRLPGGRGVPTPIRVADRAIDIMSLFTAATIVAAFGNLGLVSDLVVLVQTLYRV